MWKRLNCVLLVVFALACLSATYPAAAAANEVKVHFIDVGQADCILVQTSQGKNVLIDAGDDGDAEKVISYLQKNNVATIDMLIATHPHHDHIGSMDEIIQAFSVDIMYMPGRSHQTRFYSDLQKAIRNNKVMTMEARAGQTIKIDKNVKLEVLAPLGKKYRQMNDYSLVMKLIHKKNTFLLMADTGKQSEKEMLSKNVNVKADVMKIGHHGADSSTTEDFLEEVDPETAVITAESRHKHKLPSENVLARLKLRDVKIYRTDRVGNVVAESDGEKIIFHTSGNQS